MLSSRFLVVSFLYIFYSAGLVSAEPRDPFGGNNQLCQSVKTVTVTVSARDGRSTALPVITTRPGNVNLGNGATTKTTSSIKNTKTSSVKPNTKPSGGKPNTSTVKNVNTKTRNVNTKTVNTKPANTKTVNTNTKPVNTKTVNTNTKPVNTKTVNTKTVNTKTVNTKTINTKIVNTKTVNTKTSTIKANPTIPPVKGTKTSSIATTPTLLSTTSLPPVSTTDRSLAVSSSSTAAPPANTGTGNPDTSLTLDPSVIQNVDGKGQAAGESDSLVSPNNFIGFCAGKTITNGLQVKQGSCNPVPMGDIPSKDNMPSAKFNFPKNFDTIAPDTPFTISLQVRNLVTGTFTNAANTYYAAPQQLVNGVIQGHSHVTVQLMKDLKSTEPLDPKVFAFFKGLNAASPNGVLTADVTKGLPAGVYRLSSINSAGNHQEALGPVAQRGSFNDVVYFTVTAGGSGANNSNSSSAIPPASNTLSSSVVNPTATLPDVSSSSVLSSTVSSPDTPPTPPAVPSPADNGGKGGKDPKTSPAADLPATTSSVDPVVSSTPPVSETGGKNGGKGGDAVSTSAPLPDSTTPPAKDGNQGDSPSGKGRGGGNGQNSKRMHRRSRLA